jgi:Ser/Thr protein kinase RdoA (MazF antagonist)
MPGWTDALPAFGLPAAPTCVDELCSAAPGLVEAFRAEVPAGRFLVICSSAPLALAFEATLFDLLAENRYPAPRPRRARSGSLIARLPLDGVAAACYAWPVGEEVTPTRATQPQLLEVGRLLARLHQLGEAHPAKVADGADARSLLCRCEAGPQRDAFAEVLSVPLEPLPSGAVHGGVAPGRALFIGDRCSAVLPSGVACFGPLAIDLAEAAVGFLCEDRPLLALRALLLGYQSLRRLLPEEVRALPSVLRLVAAREGVRRAARGAAGAVSAFEIVRALGDDEIRAVAAA